MKIRFRTIGSLVLGIAAVCALMLLWTLLPHASIVQTGNHLTREDLREIQKAIGHDRWGIARSLVLRRQFSRAFQVWALGKIQRVEPDRLPRASSDGSVVFVKGALVECKPQSGQTSLKYEVESTTNGHWKVVVVVFPAPLKTSSTYPAGRQRGPL